MDASLHGANLEIPPWFVCGSNLGPLSGSGTVHGRQFDWGGLLPKRNGGVRRYAWHGRTSCLKCKGKSVLDCESDKTNRCESRI